MPPFYFWLTLPLAGKVHILESLVGMRRAGADFIVTYFAKEAARLLQ